MIKGEVTADREAIIKLRVSGPGGKEIEIEAVLDTGFSEYLTLPSATISALNLPYQNSMPLVLADGTRIRLHVYDATVLWDGQKRTIPVQSAEATPLIGMFLIYGSQLVLDAVDGGLVTIKPLSQVP